MICKIYHYRLQLFQFADKVSLTKFATAGSDNAYAINLFGWV